MDIEFGSLCKEAACFKQCALAESTKSTYRSQLNCYIRFCLYFDQVQAPADHVTLKAYVAFLAHTLNPNSIPGYLNGIRLMHVSAGLGNPLHDKWEINMVKRGISRRLGRPPRQKLPITLLILHGIWNCLNLLTEKDMAFWCA